MLIDVSAEITKKKKKKATQHKIQSFLRECPNKFSHGKEANILPFNPLQQLWKIKTKMQTWGAWQQRKTMMVFWQIKGHYNLCFLLLNLLSYYKAGKLDYSGITTYWSVFNTTSCIWKKLVETKLQSSITSMKSLSLKGKRDNNTSTHFYRYILFSSYWTFCMLFGFIIYKIRILILLISDC